MPIEIKQLEIRGIVHGNNEILNTKEILNNEDIMKLKSDILAICIEKVEELLKKKMER